MLLIPLLKIDSLRALAHRQVSRFTRIVNGMKPQTQTLGRAASEVLKNQQGDSEVTLLSIGQTAQLSGVSEADLLGLVEYGVLTPTEPESGPCTFDVGCVMGLQRAALMRQDLALDSHGFALTVMFLNQITELEVQLQSMQRNLRDCRSLSDAYAMHVTA